MPEGGQNGGNTLRVYLNARRRAIWRKYPAGIPECQKAGNMEEICIKNYGGF